MEVLCKLHVSDLEALRLESMIRRIPSEQAALKERIQKEQDRIQEAKHALQALEVERKQMDIGRQAAEQKLLQYKVQQMNVRKQDEYDALTRQMSDTEAAIGQFEDAELKLLMHIEAEQAAFHSSEACIQARIQELTHELNALHQRSEALSAQLAAHRLANEALAATVEGPWLNAYKLVKERNKPPFIATLQNHQCMGCHLRVSNETAERIQVSLGPVYCDQCGRLLCKAEH